MYFYYIRSCVNIAIEKVHLAYHKTLAKASCHNNSKTLGLFHREKEGDDYEL